MGVKPILLEGQTIEVTSGPFAGRMGVVLRQNFASDADYLQFNTAGHPKRMFAKVDSYIVKTRDSRNEQISVSANDAKALDSIDGWARGQAPEEAPGGEGFENQLLKAQREADAQEGE
jgi:low affinity Fe/Cu permease